MFELPIIKELKSARKILIAGAGGGFDVFCGLPLYFALRAEGKEVHLANLSFSTLPHGSERIGPGLVKVNALTAAYTPYFPEMYLSRWFREHEGEDVPIYCFDRTGVAPLVGAYRQLVELLDVDTIVLVDGGTDSLMRGDEEGLGTPHEDASSLMAANETTVARKLLVCLGFGIDYFHGVCHAHFLEAVAELIKADGYLGMFSLLQSMPEVAKYRSASHYVFQSMPRNESIVSSSIVSSLSGQFGDYHATNRTSGSKLWINPLMSVYWCFHLGPVVNRLLYRDEIIGTKDFGELRAAISAFRGTIPQYRSAYPMPL